MNRRVFVVALVPVITAGCSLPKPAVAPAPPTTGSSLRVQAGDDGGVQRVPLEDYVAVSVVSESAPSGEPSAVERMFEVQAIVGRSYALASRGRHGNRGFDVCSTTHCQLYLPDRLKTSRWAPLVAEAVRRTAGVVIWHGTGPALALFHADCGGH